MDDVERRLAAREEAKKRLAPRTFQPVRCDPRRTPACRIVGTYSANTHPPIVYPAALLATGKEATPMRSLRISSPH